MEKKQKAVTEMKKLQRNSGMTMMEFAKYFGIPYRTVQNWCDGSQNYKDYLLRLMHYKLAAEDKLVRKDSDNDTGSI